MSNSYKRYNNFHLFDFKNKKALVRVDFNVPLDKELNVLDDTRIQAAIPTILNIIYEGGTAILVSHLGRPKNGPEDKFSLRPVATKLSQMIGKKILFAKASTGKGISDAIKGLKPGQILLLENLRFHPEEKKGDPGFAKQLADLGCDVYVNDAFGTAHRAHASTSVVATYFDKKHIMPGYLMKSEIYNATKVLNNPQTPFTAILGGAKVSDKILLIESLLDRANHIIIGGGMAFTFVKAQGGKIGKSLVEDDKLDLAKSLLQKAKEKGVKIHLPEDSVIADKFDNGANIKESACNNIPNAWMGLDIGPKARKAFGDVIAKSKMILWNGPMGVFEMENFSQGTKSIAIAVGKASKNGAYSLVGGGDSVAAVKKFDLEDQISFVSTGGGAMLEFFEGKDLPGIKALEIA